ncbi:MAG: hypothetical protein EZS28_024598 [Streblomastix strix]|uniref:Uncharacterized protein n=1 Tax=Streblomastix strix TaxID=222440 RepID=A0A5J4VBN1_9EUKA|nr:MAG: hypothetical protein EZS28_024598 [Streblomastix strix]
MGAIFDTHNYKKCSKGKYITDSDKVTGSCLDINQMKNNQLTILDFDIPHNTDKYNKEAYQQHIIRDLLPKNTPILITAHGGVHAYVNRYNYPLKRNRLVASKKIPFQFFTVDVFAQIDKYKFANGKPNGIKENIVTLPDSIIHDDDYQQTQIEYCYPTAPATFWEQNNFPSLWEILNMWNVDLRQDEYVKEDEINQRVTLANGTNIPMNEALIDAIIEGYKNIQILNFATRSKDEITLLPLFQSLNSLKQYINEDRIEELYNKTYLIANLTVNARKYWSDVKQKVGCDYGIINRIIQPIN